MDRWNKAAIYRDNLALNARKELPVIFILQKYSINAAQGNNNLLIIFIFVQLCNKPSLFVSVNTQFIIYTTTKYPPNNNEIITIQF